MLNRESRRLVDWLLEAPRSRVFVVAGALLLAVAWLDWSLGPDVTLGVFYILPVLLLSVVLSRPQILLVAALCGFLRILFNRPATVGQTVMVGGFAVLAYALIGLFAFEVVKNRKEILDHLNEIRHQQVLRRDAEEQLRFFGESSPAAIFTVDEHARILSANRATRELLRLENATALIGHNVDQHLPVLAEALKVETGEDSFRTVTQVQGKGRDGIPFLAQVCFSTYQAEDGSKRLAAIAFDSTEDTREREEQNQLQMQENNRIIAGAVAHEVRNVCSAMAVVCSNLGNIPGVVGTRDYQALEHLVSGLGKLARLELHGRADSRATADVRDVLSHLRILISPSWEEQGARINWPTLRQPLLVAADSFTLLQVFLNLANNSLSAVSAASGKQLTVEIETSREALLISFRDTAGGVSDPGNLFQPFRTGSESVGLGLYVSRALLRRYGGDVRYENGTNGPKFIVEAPLYGATSDVALQNRRDTALAGR